MLLDGTTRTVKISRNVTETISYGIGGTIVGLTACSFPLMLGYALTAHKVRKPGAGSGLCWPFPMPQPLQ